LARAAKLTRLSQLLAGAASLFLYGDIWLCGRTNGATCSHLTVMPRAIFRRAFSRTASGRVFQRRRGNLDVYNPFRPKAARSETASHSHSATITCWAGLDSRSVLFAARRRRFLAAVHGFCRLADWSGNAASRYGHRRLRIRPMGRKLAINRRARRRRKFIAALTTRRTGDGSAHQNFTGRHEFRRGWPVADVGERQTSFIST